MSAPLTQLFSQALSRQHSSKSHFDFWMHSRTIMPALALTSRRKNFVATKLHLIAKMGPAKISTS